MRFELTRQALLVLISAGLLLGALHLGYWAGSMSTSPHTSRDAGFCAAQPLEEVKS